jgi:hypothetical protein
MIALLGVAFLVMVIVQNLILERGILYVPRYILWMFLPGVHVTFCSGMYALSLWYQRIPDAAIHYLPKVMQFELDERGVWMNVGGSHTEISWPLIQDLEVVDRGLILFGRGCHQAELVPRSAYESERHFDDMLASARKWHAAARRAEVGDPLKGGAARESDGIHI